MDPKNRRLNEEDGAEAVPLIPWLVHHVGLMSLGLIKNIFFIIYLTFSY
ncbi:hypothetical protein SAMN06265218_1283 [Fodinibius sediminis]|uniref:Uncharacterized protein n=1 Tax=Fodinibius sediminis TaxID=1214077 RepID=A0A521FAW0_9BACT|nr:hypothetical protein SAMN06265218_1283 [Fodinibius sediminis]